MTSAGFRYDILSNLSGAGKGEKEETRELESVTPLLLH